MLTIRRATMDDMEKVIDFRIDFLREYQPDACAHGSALLGSTRRYFEEKLPSSEIIIWFAEEDGRIIGTSGLIFFQRPPTHRNAEPLHAYILNMYTVPEYRGRGVATVLLRNIIEYVKTTPAKRICLHTSTIGRPVYERLGFVPTSNEMVLTLEE